MGTITLWPAMDKLVKEIDNTDPLDEDYKKLVARLNELVHIDGALGANQKNLEAVSEPWYVRLLNNGPLVTGGLTLIGVIWMTHYEKTEVVTSRALGWLRFK